MVMGVHIYSAQRMQKLQHIHMHICKVCVLVEVYSLTHTTWFLRFFWLIHRTGGYMVTVFMAALSIGGWVPLYISLYVNVFIFFFLYHRMWYIQDINFHFGSSFFWGQHRVCWYSIVYFLQGKLIRRSGNIRITRTTPNSQSIPYQQHKYRGSFKACAQNALSIFILLLAIE